MIPIVILASGRGSNFDAILAATQHPDPTERLHANILAVISDRSEALVLEKARQARIPALAIPFEKGTPDTLAARREAHDARLIEKLNQLQPRFLVLAGYMRIMTDRLIEQFRSEKGEYSRIVNIHPSLLPAFPGKDSYSQAFRYGVRRTGVTVHLVEQEVDSGPICAQESFSIESCQREEEVEKMGLAVEHKLYPETLRWVLPERFSTQQRVGGRWYVRPN